MNDRIKLNILSSGDYLIFHTYSRAHKLSHSFYVNRDKFWELERNGFVAVFDHPSVLTIRINNRNNTVIFTFAWLNRYSSGELHGREEIVTVPEAPLMEFVRRSEEPDGAKRWAALALPEPRGPRLVFRSRRNLKAVIGNRMLYRKFRKELNQHFHWQGSDEIIIYDDFMPYSFGFTEMRNGESGICGGIILHNYHNDLTTAYYGIHT